MSSEEDFTTKDKVVLFGFLVVALSFLFIVLFVATADVAVVDQVPESEFDGDYRPYDTLSVPEEGVVGDLVAEPEVTRQIRAGGRDYTGAYEYRDTIYIVEQSSPHFDFGAFEWKPFGE